MENLDTEKVSGGATRNDSTKNIVYVFLVGFLILIAACVITLLYKQKTPTVTVDTPGIQAPPTYISASLNSNPNFKEAEKALGANEDAKARALYVELAKNPATANDEGQLLYRIALTETFDNPEAAVTHLKEIAANPKFTPEQRAYAVQRIGLTYLRVSKPELAVAIFSGEPYASFYDGVDTQLALRKLFEYCSTLYPVAMCDLRAGLWYTKQLQLAYNKGATSTEFVQLKNEYLPIVEQQLARANVNIEKTKGSENEGSLIPEILYVKAVNYARLAHIGLSYDFETAMNFALNAAKVSSAPGSDGQVRYAYTVALLRKNRVEDAKVILQPMLENFANYDGLKRMFLRERTNNLGEKGNILLIAKNIPEFKQLLLSIGWVEADFTE